MIFLLVSLTQFELNMLVCYLDVTVTFESEVTKSNTARLLA